MIKSELQNQFFHIAKKLSNELKLELFDAQRLVYYYLVKKTANNAGIKLPFPIKKYEICLKQLKNINFPPDIFHTKRESFDKIFELIDVEERRKTGQILTPKNVAEFMTMLGTSKSTESILDPAIGPGIFEDEFLSKSDKISIVGYDIDELPLNATYVRTLLQKPNFKKITLRNEEFLENTLDEKFDLIICNPPYLNFHNFDNKKLCTIVSKKCDIKISQLTNIYSLFLLASSKHVIDKGRMVFITPTEFFYTGYGETLKRFLLENFTIIGFVIFDFAEILFDGILTTAVITYVEKKQIPKNHKVNFIKIKKWPDDNQLLLSALITGESQRTEFLINRVEQVKLDPLEKWLIYFEKHNQHDILEKLVPLSKIGHVNRGIATGQNNFFTFTGKEAREWNIESEFLKPVLTKAMHTKKYDFSKIDHDALLRDGKKALLLYCFNEPSKNLKKYIQQGEKMKVHEGYLCAHRKPWFSMEKGKVAPILATVFHRDNVRFILNKAQALHLAAYHGVYPNFDDEMMIKALLCYLNSDICGEMQIISRREYGGGLHKFEPRDLEKMLVIDITKLDRIDIIILAKLFENLCEKNSDEQKIRENINFELKRILLKY